MLSTFENSYGPCYEKQDDSSLSPAGKTHEAMGSPKEPYPTTILSLPCVVPGSGVRLRAPPRLRAKRTLLDEASTARFRLRRTPARFCSALRVTDADRVGLAFCFVARRGCRNRRGRTIRLARILRRACAAGEGGYRHGDVGDFDAPIGLPSAFSAG